MNEPQVIMVVFEKASDIERHYRDYAAYSPIIRKNGGMISEIENPNGDRYLFRSKAQMPEAALGLRLTDYILRCSVDRDIIDTLEARKR